MPLNSKCVPYKTSCLCITRNYETSQRFMLLNPLRNITLPFYFDLSFCKVSKISGFMFSLLKYAVGESL